MYTEFYGFKEIPFGLTPDPKYIFKTDSHLEVMSNLKYGVYHCKGIVVVTGEVGTGKTTTLRSAMQQFTQEILCVYIFNPFITVSEFFEQFAAGLGIPASRASSKPEILDALGRLLAERHQDGMRTVLIMDEAHGLPPD